MFVQYVQILPDVVWSVDSSFRLIWLSTYEDNNEDGSQLALFPLIVFLYCFKVSYNNVIIMELVILVVWCVLIRQVSKHFLLFRDL